MIIHDRYFDFYQDIMYERCPKSNKGHTEPYHKLRAIQDVLFKENLGKLIEVRLEPYKYFKDGYVTSGNQGYGINIEDGMHSVSYLQLLSVLLESTHSTTPSSKYIAEITSICSRPQNQSVPIRNFIGVETLSLEQSKDDYKNWVELATSFDS